MSFEKILYKLRDAWRGDIRRSLEGLPGYYWGEVTGPGEVLLDAVAPGSDPVPVDDLVGALVGDRVLLVLVDGAFSVVGVADRPRGVPRFDTVAARDAAFPAPVDGQVSYVTGNGYYVRDGGVWRTVLDDTGWVGSVLSDASGFTNTVTARLRDGRVSLRGTVSGTFTANTTTTVGTITDTRFRPDAVWGGATTTTGGLSAPYLAISSAGVVTVRTSTSGSANVYLSPATYFA